MKAKNLLISKYTNRIRLSGKGKSDFVLVNQSNLLDKLVEKKRLLARCKVVSHQLRPGLREKQGKRFFPFHFMKNVDNNC